MTNVSSDSTSFSSPQLREGGKNLPSPWARTESESNPPATVSPSKGISSSKEAEKEIVVVVDSESSPPPPTPKVFSETVVVVEEMVREESPDNGNEKAKKLAWNKPSNGVVEVGNVMGASSWPTLPEFAKASPKSSSDSLKNLSDGSAAVTQDPFDRTKVVLRHLPPSLSQSALLDQIDGRFPARYKWFSFRPGNNSQKNMKHSRAYIDFKRPEDVVEFAEFFDGHVFVNEKGTQFKTIVEYAPSQRVPKSWSKKDGREGTLLKDPEYVEFLEFLSKPVENLPSAEIQLEKREAERAGASKDTLIVTPLMDFVRQKRAAKSGSQRANGKASRRSVGAPPGNSRSTSTKRGSEKRRNSTSMYVLRDSSKNASGKEKSTYMLVPRHDDQQPSDKSIGAGTVTVADGSGASGAVDSGKKKILLLKGKEREIAHSSTSIQQQQCVTSPVRNSIGSPSFRPNQRREPSGRMIRSILLNKEARQNQSSTAVQSEQHISTLNLEKEKRPPRATNVRSVLKDHLSSVSQVTYSSDNDPKRIADVSRSDHHGSCFINERQEKRTRNKDRPDRGVWTLRRSDGAHASDETLSLSDSLEGVTITHNLPTTGVSKLGGDAVDGTEYNTKSYSIGGKPKSLPSGHVETKVDIHNSSRSGEPRNPGSIRGSVSVENGSHRHIGRRGPAYGLRDVESSLSLNEAKPSKRGGAGYGSHEKQVWVQKSGSGS